MRWSRTLLPTLRDDPVDAESASHKLLIRAGFVRRLSAGVYSYLPLGIRALQKAAQIVREEMDRAGAVELLMPVLHPPELWQESGRFELFGDTLFKLKDRKGAIHVLGPTHEEVVVHLVRTDVKSYRQLPMTLYQIQVKFRDEPRPQFGVVRTREFLMKDAYSFDADERGMNRSYQAMYDAYVRIFSRAELNFLPVEAETGLIGGDVSHEFMALSPAGEDEIVACAACKYAANKEKAECVPVSENSSSSYETLELLPREEVATPGMTTIEQVSKFLRVRPVNLMKTLIFRAARGFVAALVRGDHEVNLAKLRRAAKSAVLEMATPEEIQQATGGPVGFSGPVGLKIPIFADHSIEGQSNFVTGANRADTHLRNVNANRDFRATAFADLRTAVPGDPCPKCKKPLAFARGIEIGHVFKLGTRYSAKMSCDFLDPRGQLVPMVMGCYGIGVNRIVASAVENHHDEAGIVWPKELAPYSVEVVTVNPKGDLRLDEVSRDVYERLTAAGLDVLWDDRELSPGVKFSDADLIGLPIRVILGKKTIESGTADLKARNKGGQDPVPLAGIVEAVKHALAEYRL